MVYRNTFKDLEVSALGLGTMRLPLVPGGKPKDIDQPLVDAMVDCAIANGVNYFDTALPYHESCSETAIGAALARYPRESWLLADKYPGHQIMDSYNPSEIFEEQLEKCGVEYFDFYLMHNVNESSLPTYLDPRWGLKEYFVEQKRLGRIRHLGFSCHGDVPCIEAFLEKWGDAVEFCQIQLNYLDWTLQDAEAKYSFLTARGLPVWVMEPVRGGRLASLGPESDARLSALRPGESIPSLAFRFLQGKENVKVILSGMSSLEQVKDNTATFAERRPLTPEESEVVFAEAERLKNAVPCTACRYCCHGCPAGLEIPKIIALYNDCRIHPSLNISMRLDALGAAGDAARCVGCGQCAAICPQGINVPELMPKAAAEFSRLPSWAQLCKERSEAAAKARAAKK